MCTTDYDMPEVYSQKTVKARKKHHCCECRRVIDIGEKYQYTFGIWERTPSVFKTCCYCLVAQNWLEKECGAYLHGGLIEEIEEHAYEYKLMLLYRLLIGMKTKWKTYWKPKPNEQKQPTLSVSKMQIKECC